MASAATLPLKKIISCNEMLKTRIIGIVAATIFSSLVQASTYQNAVVQIDEFVDDRPVASYVNRWWQWTYSMPKQLSPVRDRTGELCHIGQQGNVWFLAGGYGLSLIHI